MQNAILSSYHGRRRLGMILFALRHGSRTMGDTKKMSTWVVLEKEVMEIKGKYFETCVRGTPHSECSSGSACLYHAVMEFTDG